MKVSVFVGPSIAIGDARALLPGAVFHPPAEQGDLLAAVDFDEAQVIGLIDGTFHQNLSVWHNEVCYLLSRGVSIYGSSSMGALRAAETEKYGMVGVGRVFEWYRDGRVCADDEVALIHGEADSNFRPLSHPLVNIRASLDSAVNDGSVDPYYAASTIELARSLHYSDRHISTVMDLCRRAAYPAKQLLEVDRALTSGYVDVKQEDARELLQILGQLMSGVVEPIRPAAFDFARSTVFEAMYDLDRRVGGWDSRTSLQDVAEHVALQARDYEELSRSSLHRDLCIFLGHLLGLEISSDDVMYERDRFLELHALTNDALVADWLRLNAISDDDLDEFLADEALCRRLRRWARSSQGFDRGIKPILDELRRRGEFPNWAQRAVAQELIVTSYRDAPEYAALTEEDPAELAARHGAATGVNVFGDAAKWAEDRGFEGVQGLADALRRAELSRRVNSRIAKVLTALNASAAANDATSELTAESE